MSGVDDLHVISLGAGVQSSAMALMAAAGELTPMPAAAIFADTQAEPASVYRWLDWLKRQLPFPVIRATAGDLSADSLRLHRSGKTGKTYLRPSLPVFTVRVTESGTRSLFGGPLSVEAPLVGRMGRQCTEDYKIVVVRREARRLMRAAGARHIMMWIGISTDEADRAKPAMVRKKASRADAARLGVQVGSQIKVPHPYITNTHPLLVSGHDRAACQRRAPGAPRSACRQCPFKSDFEWLRMKTEEPAEFELAAVYEDALRVAVGEATAIKADDVFLHRSLVPLREVRFEPHLRRDGFAGECEGMCGV